MCDHTNDPGGREAAMVILDPGTPERQGRDGVWCDPCLAPIVKGLNENGLRTVASCCGHGRRPGRVTLADGRDLFIMPDFESAQKLDALMPYPGIIGEESVAAIAGTDFATNREKLDVIRVVVNEMFGFTDPDLTPDIYNCLAYIDSVCDIPLSAKHAESDLPA